MLALGPAAVVVTGGHAEDGADLLVDGGRARCGSRARAIRTAPSHGSGCTHSSALAAFLARGAELADAARWARRDRLRGGRHGLRGIGAGAGPVDVFGSPRRRRRSARHNRCVSWCG